MNTMLLETCDLIDDSGISIANSLRNNESLNSSCLKDNDLLMLFDSLKSMHQVRILSL